MERKLLGIINVGLDATGEMLIIYSVFFKYINFGNTTMSPNSYLQTSRRLLTHLGGRSCDLLPLSLIFK